VSCCLAILPGKPASQRLHSDYPCRRQQQGIAPPACGSRSLDRVLQMRDRIAALAEQWKPDLVLIEDTSSGMGLIQLLKEQSWLNVYGRRPKDDKETRMSRHQGRFEVGRVLLPTEAPWLADFENELLSFPGGRYDDQVDAFMLFLDWFSQNEPNISTTWVAPIVITRADVGLAPLIRDWSCRY
jgi:predicted phage terminase large subunit-like protein